ncbi:MAG: hypothetical protein AAGJ86_13515 [Pseudomonadota bacterium]
MTKSTHTAVTQALLIVFAAILFSPAATAAAQVEMDAQLNFPSGIGEVGEPPKKNIINSQRKAEKAYNEGRYRDAFWYYRKDLAPVGDKYAQYMVGYMMENGLGTDVDKQGAAAWYLLAAERGHEEIVKVSLDYQREMSPGELASVKARTASLKGEMGDRALIERLIRRDVDRINNMTGTRTGQCGLNARVYRPRDARGSTSQEVYCQEIKARIEMRMQYLGGYVEFGELELLPDEEEDAEASEQ